MTSAHAAVVASEVLGFEAVVEQVGGTPWMTPDQGRRIWEHFTRTTPTAALDVGTCFGASAAYMATAMRARGGGRVVTVDSALFDGGDIDVREWCRDLWRRCGVADMIEMVRIPHSNYAWWLMDQVARHTPSGRTCDPCFDFAYLDGAKWLTLDAASVVLIEPLLRPGGWLLLDDLDWAYAEHPELVPTVTMADGASYRLSPDEIDLPHVRAVFDHVVRNHPSFTRCVDQGGVWGWAEKRPDRPQTVVVQRSGELPEMAERGLGWAWTVRARLRGRG